MTDQTDLQREREVDAHVAAGEVTVHADARAFLEYLDKISADCDRPRDS